MAHQRRTHLLEPLPKRGVAFDLNVPVAANLHARGFEKFANGPAVKVFFIGPARQKRDGLRIVDDACAQHRPQVNDRARLDVHHVFQAPDLAGRQCILPCLREGELGQIHLSRIFQIIFQIERSHRTLPFQWELRRIAALRMGLYFPLLEKGINILDASCTQTKENLEIGRFLHLKSRNPEILNRTRNTGTRRSPI